MTVMLLRRSVWGEALRSPCERLHCREWRRGQHVAGTALRYQANVPGDAGQHGEGRRETGNRAGRRRFKHCEPARSRLMFQMSHEGVVLFVGVNGRRLVVWLPTLASNTLWSKSARRRRAFLLPSLRGLVLWAPSGEEGKRSAWMSRNSGRSAVRSSCCARLVGLLTLLAQLHLLWRWGRLPGDPVRLRLGASLWFQAVDRRRRGAGVLLAAHTKGRRLWVKQALKVT